MAKSSKKEQLFYILKKRKNKPPQSKKRTRFARALFYLIGFVIVLLVN
jgi:hypothetical protein